MTSLALCILLTTYLTLAFKQVGKLGLNNVQVITFNYLACIGTGLLMEGRITVPAKWIQEAWFGWALLQGIALIVVFNLIAYTTQRLSVAIASVANKLSLVIPFGVSLYLYGEKAGLLKIAGLILAFPAVVMSCWPENRAAHTLQKNKWLPLILPMALFVGSGCFDTLVKYVEQGYLNQTNYHTYLITAFSVAAACGLLIMMAGILRGWFPFQWKSLLAGIAIGIPNYFSLFLLMKVLKSYPANSSTIIPVNNTGVLVVSTLAAALLFKEHLSAKNRTGIVLAILSMAMMAIGSL